MSAELKLIVGLGNPGPQYTQTRHNAGKWFLTELCQYSGVTNTHQEKKFKGEVAKLTIANTTCWLLCPTTYMNCSGESVSAMAKFYDIPAKNILVAHDELDLPVGTIRLKKDGGHGGHNGIRNIIDHLHTKEFYRLRIGIGHPGNAAAVHDYVLSKPSKSDASQILAAIDSTLTSMPEIVQGNMEQAMQELHTKT